MSLLAAFSEIMEKTEGLTLEESKNRFYKNVRDLYELPVDEAKESVKEIIKEGGKGSSAIKF